jgi:hypothetical protein
MEAVTGKRGGPQNILKFCGHARDAYEVVKVAGMVTPDKPFPLAEYKDTVAKIKADDAKKGQEAVARVTKAVASKEAI